MHAKHVVLETDEEGNLIGMPKLPPNTRLEAIFWVPEGPATTPVKRKPHPAIAGKAQTLGDLISPVVDEAS